VRRTRPKLDPRLAHLLSLPRKRLRALKREEHRRLSAASAEPDSAPSASKSDRRSSRLLWALTGGVYFPSREAWERGPAAIREPYISAFILADISAADLSKLGARVRSQACDVFTAFVPLSRVPALEAAPGVRYIELAGTVSTALDQAIPYTGMDVLHNTAPPLNGAGVIVGVVDVYLDLYHPDFRLPNGRTRVFYLWDQALTPQGQEKSPDVNLLSPTPFTGSAYGVEYDQTTIDAELAAFNPPNNYQIVRHGGAVEAHGTHVAGIAAGNGRGQNGTYTGAAPAANVIFVRPWPTATIWTTDSATMADAVAYVFARAALLDQPAVVNLSMSAYDGPRDGSRLIEQFLDSLVAASPGRAVVAAAGNENDPTNASVPQHATGVVPVNGTVNLLCTFASGATLNERVEIWYSGVDQFDVTITAEDAQQGIAATAFGLVSPGQTLNQALTGGFTVNVTSVLHDPLNQDNAIVITITVPAQKSVPAHWTIQLTGTVVVNGTFHAWLSANNHNFCGWAAAFKTGDAWTIGIPGCANRVIAVGNHDKSGPPPAILFSSGCGPTRDGRVKPELATTGTFITAPRSRNMNDPNPGALYVAKFGTSMASPMVAGACALLFQCKGASATWADLLSILKANAIPENPVNAFGAGYMQLAAACSPPAQNVDVWLRDDVSDTGVEPFVGPVNWLSPDIEVLDANGQPVPNPKYNPNASFNNIIGVTARNRGLQPAIDTEVYLYWADPATYLPFTVWNKSGIFVGQNFQTTGNKIVIPQIAPGAAVAVQFGWAPPPPGSNIRRDDHFCLIARLENAGDPSNVGPGGWDVIAGRNNVGLHNVHVQQSPAEIGFLVRGTDDEDGLVVIGRAAGGQVELSVPVQALPWRDARVLGRRSRLPYGCSNPDDDPVAAIVTTLEGDTIRVRTDIVGARAVRVRNGIATIVSAADATVTIPCLRVAPAITMPVNLRVTRSRATLERRDVHVGQLSGGRRVGGVTLRLEVVGKRRQGKR
jgi:Subtilase family